MAKNDILDSYEELLNFTDDVRATLTIVHDWLSKKPSMDNYINLYELVSRYDEHFALLNLILFRLDSLQVEHRNIIEQNIQGE